MLDYERVNRSLWDVRARRHRQSEFYDVEGFRAGRSSLRPLERAELGDVRGKRLLHLQCHFGQDTLSWAREGAVVTGVDFSPEGIRIARELSLETGIPAEFLEASVLELPRELDGRFDVVFTSYGVLAWLPDLRPWAEGIARCLRPGGTFYIAEFHPLLGMLDDAGDRIQYPYFHSGEPLELTAEGSYADRESGFRHPGYEWTHSLADVVGALLERGLRLEFLHEFPYVLHPCYPFLVESEPGRYVLREHPGMVPLLFSIRASGPGWSPGRRARRPERAPRAEDHT